MTEIEKEELETLKLTATNMGITYSPNIGIDALKKKIESKQASSEEEPEEVPVTRDAVKKEALKLIRVSVRCNNPSKANQSGEYFTVANAYLGKVARFVPTDGTPWHVEQCIYNQINAKKFQMLDENSPNEKSFNKLVPEFTVTVLPPLTKEELAELAKTQQAGNRID